MRFFFICRQYNLLLHQGKCMLFALSVRWCGRLIDGVGVLFDPRRLTGLQSMIPPESGADLQKFLCALGWMSTALPCYSALVGPLAELLEAVYEHAGARTKAAVSRVFLYKVGWSLTHEVAFQECKDTLASATMLPHLNYDQLFCVYTDAS
jgi:hypothetical protein